MNEKVTAIVLSAGRGRRMNSDISKQYMDLCGKPVIYYTLQAFQDSDVHEIVLVSGRDEMEYCKKEIADRFNFTKVMRIVSGGNERYNSVYNGLMAAEDCKYVMIHDGARPFITPEQINMLISEVKCNGACVAGMPVKDTIKQTDDDNNIEKTPDRRRIWQVQTPQCFEYNIIKEAYENIIAKNTPLITDDAMVLELYNKTIPVKMVQVSYENIKITTPEDIFMGESILKKRCGNI